MPGTTDPGGTPGILSTATCPQCGRPLTQMGIQRGGYRYACTRCGKAFDPQFIIEAAKIKADLETKAVMKSLDSFLPIPPLMSFDPATKKADRFIDVPIIPTPYGTDLLEKLRSTFDREIINLRQEISTLRRDLNTRIDAVEKMTKKINLDPQFYRAFKEKIDYTQWMSDEDLLEEGYNGWPKIKPRIKF